MLRFKVEWDTEQDDGEVFTPQECGLPTHVEVPADVEDDMVADWISDKYGYCILSLREEETK